MGYIMDLRKIVGNRTLLQCGAGAIVENREGQILLQLRTDNGCWGIPGGSVEIDEEVEDTVKRELFEETGLIVEDLKLFKVFSGKELHYIYPNGDEVSNIDIVFICTKYSGELIINQEESQDLKFFGLEDLPSNILPPQQKAIRAFVEYKISIKNDKGK